MVPRITADEIDRPVMGAAKFVFRQNGVGFGGEIAIGIEQQLDTLAQFLFTEEKRLAWIFMSVILTYMPVTATECKFNHDTKEQ